MGLNGGDRYPCLCAQLNNNNDNNLFSFMIPHQIKIRQIGQIDTFKHYLPPALLLLLSLSPPPLSAENLR